MIDTAELRAVLDRQIVATSEIASIGTKLNEHGSRPYWRLALAELYRIRSSLEIIEEILNG